MCNREKTKKEDTSKETGATFSCEDFQKMFQMMSKVCKGGEGYFDCCSMMKRMMDTRTETSKSG
jgi:hypothetical protein